VILAISSSRTRRCRWFYCYPSPWSRLSSAGISARMWCLCIGIKVFTFTFSASIFMRRKLDFVVNSVTSPITPWTYRPNLALRGNGVIRWNITEAQQIAGFETRPKVLCCTSLPTELNQWSVFRFAVTSSALRNLWLWNFFIPSYIFISRRCLIKTYFYTQYNCHPFDLFRCSRISLLIRFVS